MEQKFFGKTPDGTVTYLYILENENIKIAVSDYGATLVCFTDKKTGIDVVTGFDSLEGYLSQTSYMGASIGRTANRIEKGIFSLNGKTYHLPVNNNGNCNHGGLEGFDKKVWSTECFDTKAVFSYLSKDQEEGYPGNLSVRVTYQLEEDGVSIISEGTSDADTLFAFTNHSYFNLEGSEDAMGHEVKIYAEKYGLSDVNGLTRNVLEPVENTPFDFREFKALGKEINADNEQLKFGKGYDHFFKIEGEGMRTMCEVKGKQLSLCVESDFPGMHLYTGNWLENKLGKNGLHYPERSAVAFEAEYMPNAVNYDVQEKPLLKKGETLKHTIRYRLK